MAVNIAIYSNANSTSKSISVDFEGEILAASNATSYTTDIDYFFKFNTGARTDDNIALGVKLNLGLSDLVLNGAYQSAPPLSSNAYSDITDMITDVVYDYVHGHTANQYSSGVTVQNPMQF